MRHVTGVIPAIIQHSCRFGGVIQVCFKHKRATHGDFPDIPIRQFAARRINNFQDVDIFPEGNLAVFTYDDRPGVSAALGDLFNARNINILDGRYKTSDDGKHAIAALKSKEPAPPALIDEARERVGALRAFSLQFR